MNGPMGGSKLIRENNVGGWLKSILDLFIYPLSTQTFCFFAEAHFKCITI